MSRWVCLLFCAVLAGCGVSKSVYQDQLVRTQELEARAAGLEARVETERARREALERTVKEREAGLAALGDGRDRAVARSSDLDARLSACAAREDELRADLDLCRKARSSVDADLEREKAARVQERGQLLADLETGRGEIADLRAANEALIEEKEKVEREKREKLDVISRTYEGLVEGLKEEVAEGRVAISQLKGRLTVKVLDEILFDSGSAAVKAEGREVLGRVGSLLKGMEDKSIVIEGHTDNVDISETLARRFPTNWELSAARAISVVRYLEETAGLPPERLSAMGFGSHRPVASNETPEGRLRNRRIEIKLVPLEAPLLVEPDAPPREESGEDRADP